MVWEMEWFGVGLMVGGDYALVRWNYVSWISSNNGFFSYWFCSLIIILYW